MPIAGEWRAGNSEKTAENHNPYSGELLSEIRLADTPMSTRPSPGQPTRSRRGRPAAPASAPR